MSKLDLTGMDVRVVEHHLRNRNISYAEYAKYRESLADESEEGVETESVFVSPYADRNYTKSA